MTACAPAFAGMSALRPPRRSPCSHSRSAARAERRGVLQGQERQPADRLFASAAATISMRGMLARYHGQAHSRATRRSCRRTWRAPAACARRSFLYSAAPKDGTAFGTFSRTTGITPLLESGATFDGTKFTWLGSVTNDVSTCVTWHTSAVKTWKDFLEKPVTLGGAGPERRAGHLRQPLQERVRRQDQARRRLSRHQRDHACDGARRGRRPVRAVAGAR